jgi:hypothetical protein
MYPFVVQWWSKRISGRDTSKSFAALPFCPSSMGEVCVLGLVVGDVDCPLVSSGQAQLMSKRMQFEHRGRASLH